MKFKEQWFALAGKFSDHLSTVEHLYEELADHYSEPHRFYHNAKHIENLMSLSDRYATHLTSKDVVDFSIFYHDIIYKPGRGDNEWQSAEKSKAALIKLGVLDTIIEEVVAFIEATKSHQITTVSNKEDLKFFLNFDLSILAASEEEYAAYTNGVRKEFHFMTDASFVLGRTGFLKSMLSKPHIFFTGVFREAEEKARKNIQKEIDDLIRHI